MTSSSKRIILDTFCRFINSEVKLPTLASRLPFAVPYFYMYWNNLFLMQSSKKISLKTITDLFDQKI